MTEHRIRRTGITESTVVRVFESIRKLGAPTTLQIRRDLSTMDSTAIGKAIGELKDRG